MDKTGEVQPGNTPCFRCGRVSDVILPNGDAVCNSCVDAPGEKAFSKEAMVDMTGKHDV